MQHLFRVGWASPITSRRRASPAVVGEAHPTNVPLGVCMLIQRFYPHVGGAERQLQALLPRLAERSVEPVVLTRRQTDLAPRAIVAGALVHRLPMPGGRIVASLAYTLAAIHFLVRNRRRIDVLHAHELLSPTTTAVLGKLVLRRPVVSKAVRGGWLGDIEVLRAARFGRFRIWLFARLVDRFITISQEIEQELAAAGVPPHRIVRIPNGVDTDRFQPADHHRRLALRRELGLDGHSVALFVGRLAKEKGLDYLFEAWPSVLEAHPDALLLLVGDGPERSVLEARNLPSVRFLGALDDPLPHLQASDAFVLPSSSEGLSNALLEAMSTALPCVATAIGGNVDAVQSSIDGLLVPPRNPAALATALTQALTPNARDTFGPSARARILTHYSLDRTADGLVALYRSLAGES